MYRPDDWDKIKAKAISDQQLNDENYLDNVFEAGADAMLEELRKGVPNYIKLAYSSIPGYIVFIPEEEGTKGKVP